MKVSTLRTVRACTILMLIVPGLTIPLLTACGAQDEPAVAPAGLTVANSLDLDRRGELMVLPLEQVRARAPALPEDRIVLVDGGREIATQAVDRDVDGVADSLIAAVSLQADESRRLEVGARDSDSPPGAVDGAVQAELWRRGLDPAAPEALTRVQEAAVPPNHEIGDRMFKYEGPGWESDKVGYRLYLDRRNVTDIFGKKTARLVLQDVGLGVSYHEMADWGMDILGVGASLGIGGIGALHDGQVYRVEDAGSIVYREVGNGPVEAGFEISQQDWQLGDWRADIATRYEIHVGSRLTRVSARVMPAGPRLVTGIVKHAGTEVLRSGPAPGEWAYLGTFGVQSLVPDHLGMAIFFRPGDIERTDEDDLNHLVVFPPGIGEIEYFFAAAWEQDSSGVVRSAQFKALLDGQLARLNAPLTVTWDQGR